MKVSSFLGLLFLALAVKIVAASFMMQQSPEAQVYCGSRLADMLRVVCGGKYKRSDDPDADLWNYYRDLEDYAKEISYPYAYRSKREVMSISKQYLRSKKTRIIDECCNKPCDISELRSYCAK